MAILNWGGGREENPPEQSVSEHVRSGSAGQEQQYSASAGGYGLQPDDPSEDYSPDDDDLPELPETDLEIMRDARREQARFEASDSYGEDGFETVETNDGRVLVKPQLKPPSLSELLLLAKLKKAEAEAKAARFEPGKGRVHELFAKARTRTKPMPDDGARPPVNASGWSWLRARFAVPKRPVWK